MKLFWSVCILQCMAMLVLYFGDIGFDKPGRYGLAFEHFLLLMLLQGCLLTAAVTLVIRSRQWRYLGVQFILLAATAIAVLIN